MTTAPDSGKAPSRPLRALLYVRVSKGDKQDSRSQLAALRPWAKSRGWQVVAEERDDVTGDPTRRKPGDPPGLRAAMRRLEAREADVLAVFAADRLVRSSLGLVQVVARVQALGAHVVSYQDGADLDTTSDMGELVTFLKGWFSRVEMKLIRSRTLAGLARARATRTRLGRPRKDGPTGAAVLRLRDAGLSWAEVAEKLNCKVALARRRLDGITPTGLVLAVRNGASWATLAEDFGVSETVLKRRHAAAVKAEEKKAARAARTRKAA